MIKGILNKIKLGKKGALGVAIGVTVLEFGTQAIQKFMPQVLPYFDRVLTSRAPLLGDITVRDTIVLSPALLVAIRGITSRKKSTKALMNAGAGYATKYALRKAGLNPTLFKQNKGYMAGATVSSIGGGMNTL